MPPLLRVATPETKYIQC